MTNHLRIALKHIQGSTEQEVTHGNYRVRRVIVQNTEAILITHLKFMGKDENEIIYSHIAALIGFAVVTWFSSKALGATAILMGLNTAFLIILFWKGFAYLGLIHKEKYQKET